MGMRDRMIRFMQGRYGADAFGKCLSGVVIVLLIAEIILDVVWRNAFVKMCLNTLALALLVYLYFRMFSKNYSKRYQENAKYLQISEPVRKFVSRQVNHAKQRKHYRLFKCPECKQMVRVPKGKGKIAISCPKCHKEFIRKS